MPFVEQSSSFPTGRSRPGDVDRRRGGAARRLLVNDGSSISFADGAIAIVDELEKPAPVHKRFTVGY